MALFFVFSNTNCIEKTAGVSGIRTRIVGVEGEHADHFTITTAHFLLKFRLFKAGIFR